MDFSLEGSDPRSFANFAQLENSGEIQEKVRREFPNPVKRTREDLGVGGIGTDRTSPDNKLAKVGVTPLEVIPLDMELDLNCEDANCEGNKIISASGPPSP